MNPDSPEEKFLLSEMSDDQGIEDPSSTTAQFRLIESSLCLLGSALVHGLILILLLFSSADGFSGSAAVSDETVINVSLVDAPGDGLPPGAAEEPGSAPPGPEGTGSVSAEASKSPTDQDENQPQLSADLEPSPSEDLANDTEIPFDEVKNEPEPVVVKPSKPKADPKPHRTSKATAKPREQSKGRNQRQIAGPQNDIKKAGRPSEGDSGRGAVGKGKGAAQGGKGQGVGGQGDYRKANYGYIQKRIQRNMSYPPQAKRMGITGRVTVVFTISKSGQAGNIRVSRSSGNASLDAAAIAAVQKASPFPPPPASATISIPLVFGLK